MNTILKKATYLYDSMQCDMIITLFRYDLLTSNKLFICLAQHLFRFATNSYFNTLFEGISDSNLKEVIFKHISRIDIYGIPAIALK